jgi:hypothetical protein
VTTPVSQDAWDLDRIRQIVTQNDLERGRIEYKRELGNGRKTLEAITALANTFGGVVLVGVDEEKRGLDRLVGVSASERARLVSLCWSQLTPPFSPEIVPISLGSDELYILAVVVNTDYVRRPIMLNQGNKILVRLEGENQPPDWYRLRDLFTEQAPSYQDITLPPPSDSSVSTAQSRYIDEELVLRGRLLLVGPRGRPAQITGPGRAAALTSLNSSETPLTGVGSSLVRLMSLLVPREFGANAWRLDGLANTRQFSARWEGLAPPPFGRRLAEARIRVEITPRPAHGDILLITLEALLPNPRRPIVNAAANQVIRQSSERLTALKEGQAAQDSAAEAEVSVPPPFVQIGTLREVILDMTTTLWGPAGETLSTGILSQPLGPPALLDLTIFTTATVLDSKIPPLNERIDFGRAQLIPGNTPSNWTNLGPVQPDRAILSSLAAQATLIDDWLIQFGIANGYQNIEQEVARWTGIAS